MSTGGHLITVVVPCFNAETTLARTLASVADQTYKNIEVLIVDDGSTDSSAEIAHGFVRVDSRMRLLSQPNSGVAAARNLGIAAAEGEFIALIDADDLWQPEKLESQLPPLLDDPSVGLVYSWFDNIDVDDGVFFGGSRYSFEGVVLEQLCRFDFIGNGSNALMRTKLLRKIGGYDPSLRARDAEGCEDWKVALELAELCRFAVVERSLTGYRHSSGNMSSNGPRMVRSAELVVAEFGARHPQYAEILRRHLLNRICYWLIRSVHGRRWQDGRWLLNRLRKFEAFEVLTAACGQFTGQILARALRRIIFGPRDASVRPKFLRH